MRVRCSTGAKSAIRGLLKSGSLQLSRFTPSPRKESRADRLQRIRAIDGARCELIVHLDRGYRWRGSDTRKPVFSRAVASGGRRCLCICNPRRVKDGVSLSRAAVCKLYRRQELIRMGIVSLHHVFSPAESCRPNQISCSGAEFRSGIRSPRDCYMIRRTFRWKDE